jgi:hypothetical protein
MEEIKAELKEIKAQTKYERSVTSSSQKDIENSYEEHGRISIQKQLYKVFRVTNFKIREAKEFEDSEVYKLIGPYISARTIGEVDVYLGIVSPSSWSVAEFNPHIFHIVDGSFEQCCKSLENQKDKQCTIESPTTNELPKVFNYYSIFEVTHQSKPGYKLKQLEYQLQYIVARQFHRQNKVFPPSHISSLSNNDEKRKAYREFIGIEILRLVCFAGLIMPYDFSEKKDSIIDIIKENGGLEKPCLFALLEKHRLIYFKSQTFSERLRILEIKGGVKSDDDNSDEDIVKE